MLIILPFPPASLAGHNTGQWFDKSKVVATYRAEAFHITKQEKRKQGFEVPAEGDIAIAFLFVPPDNRGDRVNFPNRLKPQIDGIAEALGVNDKRFLPSYHYAKPGKPGRVQIQLVNGAQAENSSEGQGHG